MEIRTDEVADGIYRFSTFIPEVGIPSNQYSVIVDEPVLFHTGMRLRWISFRHREADECGAMNDWLAEAAG